MPIFWGAFTIVVVFIVLATGWPAGIVSGGGLIVLSALAHSAGTTVAAVLAAPSAARTPRRCVSAATAAAVASVAWLATAVIAYGVLTYLAREVFGSAAGLIVCLGVAYLVAEFAAGQLEADWRHSARPLALIAAAVALLATAMVEALPE